MEEKMQQRDFEQEVHALYEARPELRGEQLPEDVLKACVAGETLTDAYASYEQEKQAKSKPVRQAPVKGVTRGGSVSSQPEDAFLRGFNSTW